MDAVKHCFCILIQPHCVRAFAATWCPAAEMSETPYWADAKLSSDCQPVLLFCAFNLVYGTAVNSVPNMYIRCCDAIFIDLCATRAVNEAGWVC